MATFEKRSGGWRAKIRKKGYPVMTATFDKKADAEKWASSQEEAMNRGRFVDLREAGRLTLGDGLRRYLKEVTHLKRGSKQEANRINGVWLKSDLADRPLAEITPQDLSRHRDCRLKSGISASSVKSELSIISVLYKQYDQEWNMPGIPNPMSSVRKPKVKNGRNRRLSEVEAAKLIKYAGKKQKELPLIILLAEETAMRRTELLTLTTDQVDGDIAKLTMTKNGYDREVPLSAVALDALGRLAKINAQKDGRYFSLKPNTVSNYIPIVCKSAGIKNFRFHDLRHEATSRLFELGFATMEVAAITGHLTLSQLQRYTHLNASDLANKINERRKAVRQGA